MGKHQGRVKLISGSLHLGHVFYILLIAVGLVMIGYSSFSLISGEREYASARSEYDQLRKLRPVIDAPRAAAGTQSLLIQSGQDGDGATTTYNPNYQPFSVYLEPEQPDPLAGLAEINRDFVGWIKVGDFIDYPIVRGRDNVRYLDVTFTGKYNASGAIFMDTDNKQGFNETVTVLYGHNMKDGTMFASLRKYRERAFLEENHNIIILTPEGEILLYRIFAARVTKAENRDADLGLADGATNAGVFRNAPAGSNRFLILSTCTSVYDDERLRVYAALVE